MELPGALKRLVATRLDRIVTGVIAALLVAVGYGAGIWSAETRKEVPIVFQSAPGDSDDVLTDEDLQKLVGTQSPEPSPGTGPTTSGLRGAGKAQPRTAGTQADGAFVASVNGTKYYRADCKDVNRIKDENRIGFDTEQEARDAGYEPSACVERGR